MNLPEGTSTGDPCRELLDGTYIVDLHTFIDERGDLAELYRTEWFDEPVIQINYTRNKAGVMRGAHFHLRRNEHVIIASGQAVFGIHDARPGSPTHGKSAMLDLSADKLQMIYIPAGVVHSIYSKTESLMLVGQTAYYERGDEFDCHYNDPALGFSWPVKDPNLLTMSDRDRTAGKLSQVKSLIPDWQQSSRKQPKSIVPASV